MMDYEVFKSVITERIKDFLPLMFQDYKVENTIVRKVNQEKDTLLIMPQAETNLITMPNIYLDDMYEAFRECQDIEAVLRMIAGLVMQYTGSFAPEKVKMELKDKKDSIVMNLINTKRNRELLKTVPHRDVMDLSIVYRIIMQQAEYGLMTILVDDRIMEELGLTQEELENLAYANTGRMFPAEISRMADFLYVMTNNRKIHGATTMMCREAMDLLSDKIGGNFYLIPSSIHEIMAVPEHDSDAHSLALLLEEGNRICSTESEILSDTVYYYNTDRKEFTMVASCTAENENL